MIAYATTDHGYVIVKDENGQEIGKFPLPDIDAEIHGFTDTEITIECKSGLLIVVDKDGTQLDSSLPGYKFSRTAD